MKKYNLSLLSIAISSVTAGLSFNVKAVSLTEALTQGKAYFDVRLRYETVDQDNALKNANGFTVRSRLGYRTGDIAGFSGQLEFEDSRATGGIDSYNDALGRNAGVYSVIADPETTELDQAFLQYKAGTVTAKFGRQVLTYDNHRFVGHVGWRQDRQTFDGVTVSVSPFEDLKLSYAFIDNRNRIFAEDKDVASSDHLFNAKLKTPVGALTLYGYWLEDDKTDDTLDTYGVRFSGDADLDAVKLLYTAEYATQKRENGESGTDANAEYQLLEGGVSISGITAKLGYEVLGSDDAVYGFSTPLATLHKFNGWADQFLGTPAVGLIDTYASIGGKLLGGKWAFVYHEFEADEASAAMDDLGSEYDLLYAKKFGKNYSAGIKYAAYSAGDDAAGKVDTDKVWLWVGASF